MKHDLHDRVRLGPRRVWRQGQQKSTTPENKSGTDRDRDGSATGGSTYGGAMTPAPKAPDGRGDPCAVGK